MSNKKKFYTGYNAPTHKGVSFDPAEGKTKQEFLKDCDINYVLQRYASTGVAPQHFSSKAAMYGEFDQIPDFMEMQQRVLRAREMFQALPAQVRDYFYNDPGVFIQRANTPEGLKVLAEHGLAEAVVRHTEPASNPPSQPSSDPVSAAGGANAKRKKTESVE